MLNALTFALMTRPFQAMFMGTAIVIGACLAPFYDFKKPAVEQTSDD